LEFACQVAARVIAAMVYIPVPASGAFPTVDFLQAYIPRALHFTRSDMQHNNNSPYVPNPMANNNAYLHPSPTPEEQFPLSYGDVRPWFQVGEKICDVCIHTFS